MESHEGGHSPSSETWRPLESEFTVATRLLALAEEIGDWVDELRGFVPSNLLEQDPELYGKVVMIRGMVFRRACDILNISERARRFATHGEAPEDDAAR